MLCVAVWWPCGGHVVAVCRSCAGHVLHMQAPGHGTMRLHGSSTQWQTVAMRARGRRCMTCDEYLVGEGFSAGDFGCRIVSIPTDADNDDVPDGMSMLLCGFERLCLCIAEPSLL